jgi:hypothetical protein
MAITFTRLLSYLIAYPSIRRILAESGGINPPPWCRSELALTLAEREVVYRGLASG